MKKIIKIFVLFLSVSLSQLIVSEKASAQAVSFQVFYDDLSPYGSWVQSPDYGYVWRPRLSGFSPYSTNGYWVLTDAGWTWVSDYSWGWAPFHYGRWYYDDGFGYVWVPGYEWGPGWVTWRRSNDYYGWAPIGPGVNINVAYSSGYNIPYDHWNFVRCNDFGRRDIHNHYVNRTSNVTIINNTTVINNTRVDNSRNTTYSQGPERAEVQKRIGRAVNPVAIVDEKKPAQRVTKNSVQLYRPVVQDNSTAATKPAPTKLSPIDEVKKQPNNSNIRKDNVSLRENNSKPAPQTQPVKQPVRQQPSSQVNNQPIKDQQQQVRKPVRDQQVRKVPVEQAGSQQPAQQQAPIRKNREAQPLPPVNQKNQGQPARQQPEPPVRQQNPEPRQNAEHPPMQQQPERQQQSPPVKQEPAPPRENINSQPAPQQQRRQQAPPPVRQQPQQKVNTPPPSRPMPQQQPVRQAPVQRGRKG